MSIDPKIKKMIIDYVELLKQHLKGSLVGVYLYGSLPLNGFEPDNSDIDLLIILKKQSLKELLFKCRRCHQLILKKYPRQTAILECLIIPQNYIGKTNMDLKKGYAFTIGKKFYMEGFYDLNFYVWMTASLNHAIVYGPPLKSLGLKVPPRHYLYEMRRYYRHFHTKKILNTTLLKDPGWFQYYTLISCRILYQITYGKQTSKSNSGQFVAENYSKYRGIIDKALSIRHHEIHNITQTDVSICRDLYFYALKRLDRAAKI